MSVSLIGSGHIIKPGNKEQHGRANPRYTDPSGNLLRGSNHEEFVTVQIIIRVNMTAEREETIKSICDYTVQKQLC